MTRRQLLTAARVGCIGAYPLAALTIYAATVLAAGTGRRRT